MKRAKTLCILIAMAAASAAATTGRPALAQELGEREWRNQTLQLHPRDRKVGAASFSAPGGSQVVIKLKGQDAEGGPLDIQHFSLEIDTSNGWKHVAGVNHCCATSEEFVETPEYRHVTERDGRTHRYRINVWLDEEQEEPVSATLAVSVTPLEDAGSGLDAGPTPSGALEILDGVRYRGYLLAHPEVHGEDYGDFYALPAIQPGAEIRLDVEAIRVENIREDERQSAGVWQAAIVRRGASGPEVLKAVDQLRPSQVIPGPEVVYRAPVDAQPADYYVYFEHWYGNLGYDFSVEIVRPLEIAWESIEQEDVVAAPGPLGMTLQPTAFDATREREDFRDDICTRGDGVFYGAPIHVGLEDGAGQETTHAAILLRPVIIPGSPSVVKLETAGGDAALPEGLAAWELVLGAAETEAVIDGAPLPLDLPQAARVDILDAEPPQLLMPAACASLFRNYADTAKLQEERAESIRRIEQYEAMLADERDKAGFWGRFFDSEQADRLERRIALERESLADIESRLEEKTDQIARRELVLTEEDRRRALAAIKSDPERLAAETALRRQALIDEAKAAARLKWQLIEGEKAYAEKLAAYDAMIAKAEMGEEDALADALRADRGRLELARNSWRDSVRGMYDERLAQQLRLTEQNQVDGIGPTEDVTMLLLAEGKDPVKEIETGARERARTLVKARVATDAESLGGETTQSYSAAEFLGDLGESTWEMAQDPELFVRRYSAYVKGAGDAAEDAIKDVVITGVEAARTVGQAFESGLSDVSGYELNNMGRDNLDAVVSASEFISDVSMEDVKDGASRLATFVDRRAEMLPRHGEKGIETALYGTGYVTTSVLGVEEVGWRAASQARMTARQARAARRASDAADTAADAATDAARMPRAQRAPASSASPSGDTVALASSPAKPPAAAQSELPRRPERVSELSARGQQAYNDELARRQVREAWERGDDIDAVVEDDILDTPPEAKPSLPTEEELVELHRPGANLSREQIARKSEIYIKREQAMRDWAEATARKKNPATEEELDELRGRWQQLDDTIENARAAAQDDVKTWVTRRAAPTQSPQYDIPTVIVRRSAGAEDATQLNPGRRAAGEETTLLRTRTLDAKTLHDGARAPTAQLPNRPASKAREPLPPLDKPGLPTGPNRVRTPEETEALRAKIRLHEARARAALDLERARLGEIDADTAALERRIEELNEALAASTPVSAGATQRLNDSEIVEAGKALTPARQGAVASRAASEERPRAHETQIVTDSDIFPWRRRDGGGAARRGADEPPDQPPAPERGLPPEVEEFDPTAPDPEESAPLEADEFDPLADSASGERFDVAAFEREYLERRSQERIARQARRAEVEAAAETAPRFAAPDGPGRSNKNVPKLTAGDAVRLDALMEDEFISIQTTVYTETINDYAQEMIDGSFDWARIRQGDRIQLASDGRTILHGHHRVIAAKLASQVTGRPVRGGRNPVIPDIGFEPPETPDVPHQQCRLWEKMNLHPGRKPDGE